MKSRCTLAVALATACLGCFLLMGAIGCPVTPTINENQFKQTNLTSDGSQAAAFTDTKLVNPWGLIQRPNAAFWVADNGTGVSTVYSGTGQPTPADAPLAVTIPAPTTQSATTQPATSTPTGIVLNTVDASGDFGGNIFIFVTEDGTIAVWKDTDGTSATLQVNNFVDVTGPVYKGATLITNTTGNFLLVANFRDARIDVFDKDFATATLTGDFTDPTIPADFAPFNVLALNDKVYVAYAKQDDVKHDDVAGRGNGYVSEFDLNGTFLRRIASQGRLNSPWGMVIGPTEWNNKFSGTLIVGNFGDGKINAYTLGTNPTFVGTLQDDAGTDIVNPGLWSLVVGNGGASSSTRKLYLTAGGAKEDHGLFASLELVSDADVDTGKN